MILHKIVKLPKINSKFPDSSNYPKIVKLLEDFILLLYGLVWLRFGLVWYDFASFGVCPLSTYLTMQNLELVSSKMSEL